MFDLWGHPIARHGRRFASTNRFWRTAGSASVLPEEMAPPGIANDVSLMRMIRSVMRRSALEGFSTVAGAVENPSCTVSPVALVRYVVGSACDGEHPRAHGNADGIMDGVKCVAVAPEVGIVGPHARSDKPG
ncbi:hypothetical protein KM043_008375 [Ampulex compressa]|nr:hypothetical protein KM043_008375 [Ampulex compressa]